MTTNKTKTKLPQVITLIGMSGVGKSYWAEILEKEYGYKRFSVDEIIAHALKRNDAQDVALWLGEPHQAGYFDRQNHYLHLEEQALELIFATLDVGVPTVIDTTGSVVFLSKPLLERMTHNSTVVLLQNSEKDIDQRVFEYTQSPKPVIWRNYYSGDLDTSFRKLLSVRDRLYNQWAHLHVDVAGIHTAQDFTEMVDHSKSWPYEFYLKQNILPILEKGRPDWDRPHTESVVRMTKKIINDNPALQVDPHVLIIVSYLHDYGYSELYRGKEALYPYKALKRMHAKRSRIKWESIQHESEFSFLNKKKKERIAHLIEVHDELEDLTEIDELVFMEADTLGALETSLSKHGWEGNDLKSYLQSVKKRRLPLFLNSKSEKEAKSLFKKLSKKVGWWKTFFV